MRLNEALTIRRILMELPNQEITPCLNVGSSSHQFRTCQQPHIDVHVFRPLAERGIRVVHADLRPAEGVDLVGDLFDSKFRATLVALNARLVICSNLLEHVVDPGVMAQFCQDLVVAGGYLLVTVPYSYPFHLDPIDTMYRPSPDEVVALFPKCRVLSAGIITDIRYADELRKMKCGDLLWMLLGHTIKFPYFLTMDFSRFRARYHRYFWLFRHYKISIVLLQRNQ